MKSRWDMIPLGSGREYKIGDRVMSRTLRDFPEKTGVVVFVRGYRVRVRFDDGKEASMTRTQLTACDSSIGLKTA